MADPLRLYGPAECGPDGYPLRWHGGEPSIKLLIRSEAGFRCERCRHPYPPSVASQYPRGEWTPCDEQCTHGGPTRVYPEASAWTPDIPDPERQAQWRILTTHHLNGVKWDCRWWNLAALCQRCHLTIQGKVHLERPYDKPHTEWFKPHAAGYYASEGIVLFNRGGGEPPREWVLEHMDAILDAHATQATLL